MSYTAAVDSLHARAGELYTSPGQPRRKFRLEEMRTLVEALGHPERRFRSILVAGTNGKGSTSATLAAILASAGIRTGLYTSPHLARVNERIRICGQPISDDDFARHYFRVDDCANRLVAEGRLPGSPSFFEALTALAFAALAEAQVDIAVLEVGMGGRLDATNIVDPLLSVITDVSLDHMEWLGDTITLIAREKAGILRRNGILITLPQHPEANQAIGEIAMDLDVRAINAAQYIPFEPPDPGAPSNPAFGLSGMTDPGAPSNPAMPGGPFKPASGLSGMTDPPAPSNPSFALLRNRYPVHVLNETIQVDSPLAGEHQRRNIALAIAAAVELSNHHGYKITAAHIEAGIRHTQWPGRLELFSLPTPSAFSDKSPGPGPLIPNPWSLIPVLMDVAHNPAGVWTLRAALSSLAAARYPLSAVLVFGCLRDKAFDEMAQILFPLFELVIATPVASPRSATADELLHAAAKTGTRALAAPDAHHALDQALAAASPGALIVVAGSVYLIGEVRQRLLSLGATTGTNL